MWTDQSEKEFWNDYENDKNKTSKNWKEYDDPIISFQLWDEVERFIKTYLQNNLILFKKVWPNQSGSIVLETKVYNNDKTYSTILFSFRLNSKILWNYWKDYNRTISVKGELDKDSDVVDLIERLGKQND